MKRKYFAVGLSICLAVLTLFSFVGCGENGTEELKKQIAELKTQVQTLEAALKTEQENDKENQAKLDELEGSLKTEQDKNAENQAKIDELEVALKNEQGALRKTLSEGKIPYIDHTRVFKEEINGFRNVVVQVVRNRTELLEVIDAADFFWKNEKTTWNQYDDEFFKSSALLVCLKTMGSSSIERNFIGVTVQNNQLFMFFTSHFEGNTMNDDAKPYYYFLEVKQDTVKAVEEIKIEFIEI